MSPWVRSPSKEENKTKQTVMILKASHGGTMLIILAMGMGKSGVNGKALSKSRFLKKDSHFIVFTKVVYSLSGVCSYYLYSTTTNFAGDPRSSPKLCRYNHNGYGKTLGFSFLEEM